MASTMGNAPGSSWLRASKGLQCHFLWFCTVLDALDYVGPVFGRVCTIFEYLLWRILISVGLSWTVFDGFVPFLVVLYYFERYCAALTALYCTDFIAAKVVLYDVVHSHHSRFREVPK